MRAIKHDGNPLMPHFTRRNLLAGAAAFAAWPIARAASLSGDFDVAIVGAGAAGIAAARRVAAAGKTYVVLEAAGRPGGRIASARHPSGALYERGANRFSAPRRNPLVALASAERLHPYDPPPGRRLYVGDREARDGEYDDFTASLRRAVRTIDAIAELGRDSAAAHALPDLGAWQQTVAFVLGPLICGKNLEDVSTIDLAHHEDRPDDVMIREGTAALISAAVKPLRVELNTAVEHIHVGRHGRVDIDTAKGSLSARTVIVTASTNVLASGRIKFSPVLPKHAGDALARLSLGTYERIVFDLPGNPFRFRNDERVIFKTRDLRSLMFQMRAGGTDLVYADVGGRFGRELVNAGKRAIADFIEGELAAHFGGDTDTKIGNITVTRWDKEPFVQGGFSAAAPGAGTSRRALLPPIADRVFLAGEAAHETLWGTVAGAALSGERAAKAALKFLGTGAAKEAASKPAKSRKARRRRR